MHTTTLITLFSAAFASVTTSSESTDAAANTAIDAANVDAAVELADSAEVSHEKRTFGLIAAKFYWAHRLINRGICYGCGYSNLGCGSACCRCGSTTNIVCTNC